MARIIVHIITITKHCSTDRFASAPAMDGDGAPESKIDAASVAMADGDLVEITFSDGSPRILGLLSGLASQKSRRSRRRL
jgi:hypothetical protein